ncbi:MAG TPA: AMP-binding protein [Methylomirabilota bacterium]|nr:AMP-binding protein [Methylomirabilota bacterium]
MSGSQTGGERPSPPVAAPATLLESIAGWAAETPDAPAILSGDRPPLTYAALRDHVRSVVTALNRIGVGRGDRVAIVLPHGPELATACLGVLAGAVAVPLNPEYRAAEYTAYLDRLRPRLLLTQRGQPSDARAVARTLGVALMELSPCPDAETGRFDLDTDAAPAAPTQGGLAQPSDVALVLHTSGTVAEPKRVPLTQRNLWVSAANLTRSLGLGPADRVLHQLPMFHIGGVLDVLAAPLTVGGSVVCTSRFSVPGFYRGLERFHPTWAQAVPTMLQEILAHAMDHPDIVERHSLRFVRSVSAPLPVTSMKEFERIFRVPVIEIFGMTETAGVITSNPLPPGRRKPGSVGLPAGPEVGILDRAGNVRRGTEVGEVVVRGENVTGGYEDAAEDDAELFTGGWLRTGDQGFFDEDGYLFITGRSKEIINRAGEKISPREIDAIVLGHPAVADAATFAVPHPSLGEDVAVAVVLKDGADLGPQELSQYLRERLAYFKVPRAVHFVDALPRTPGGKLRRLELSRRVGGASADAAAAQGPEAAPATPVAKMLGEIWSRVLQVPRIGIHDDFFDLGGDSLKAASVVNELQQRWGGTVYVAALFDAPTLAGFEGHLQRHYPEVVMRMLGQYVQSRAPVAASRMDPLNVTRLRRAIARPPGVPSTTRPRNPPAVFVLSPPRSGSTLLRAMLGGHSRLFAPPELYLLPFRTLADRKAWFSGSQRFQLEGNVRAVMELRQLDPDGAASLIAQFEEQRLSIQDYYGLLQEWLAPRILVDKTPSYAIHAETLARAEAHFERPLYVHLLRHPYGMIRSFEEAKLEQLWYPRLVGTEEARRAPCPYRSRELAEMVWLILHENIVRFLDGVPEDRRHRLRFEDLVVEPRPAMDRLCAFLGLEFEPAMLQPHDRKPSRMTDGVHPVSRMIGDMKFDQHAGIVAEVAERWKQEYETDFLLDETWRLAGSFGYTETVASARNRREFEI